VLRIFYLLIITIHTLFGINQKIIFDIDKELILAKGKLQQIEWHFSHNPYLAGLQKNHKLQLNIESIETYSAVTLKPIKSVKLKNELLLALKPIFPDILFVENHNKIPIKIKTYNNNDKKNKTAKENLNSSKKSHTYNKNNALFSQTDIIWLILLILSSIGLILSIIQRRQLKKIKRSQESLESEQQKLNSDIINLGDNFA